MEHSPPHPLPRKRKASQSSPIQEHRCIPQQDTSSECALLHEAQSAPQVDIPDPSPLYTVDESNTRRPKRPRLSLPSSALRTRSRRSTPPRKRGTPPPKPQPQPRLHEVSQVYPTPREHQYLLHHRASLPHTRASLLSPLTESPVALSPITPQIYVPPLLPIITRDTLSELDLESILRNPQLRHDLLFDPGLQFRPTTGRRKQVASDRYWAAVTREIEHDCTCTAWDASGVMVSCGCSTGDSTLDSQRSDGWTDRLPTKAKRTRPPTPPPWSDRYYTAYLEASADPRLDVFERASIRKDEEERLPFPVRFPSRISPMLGELVAVLKCVIAPPPLPSTHASTTVPPRLQPSSDVQNLLGHLDPPLIEQELRRGIFDPAGLFVLVGETLKRHCAPMRDRQVDAMMSVARGAEGTVTQRAVKTMRMCFEILELMKLDIANHQLQHLRPFLATSTPDFELRVFAERCRRGLVSPRVTKEWLQSAWSNIKVDSVLAGMVAGLANTRSLACSAKMDVNMDGAELVVPRTSALSRRSLVQLSLIDAITRLVFTPLPVSAHPLGPSISAVGYPETLYLDTARVALLAADVADLTALYMLLMLWRQLVFWSPTRGECSGGARGEHVFPRYARQSSRLEDWEVDRVKREIWEVGPRRIGSCFFFSGEEEGTAVVGEDRVKWTVAMQNVTLQIAMRAEGARTCTSPGPAPAAVSATTRRPPSQEALGLMSGWIQSHMRRDSALAGRLRELLRQEVAHVVTRLTFAPGSSNEAVPGSDGVKSAFNPGSGGGTAGLEPLMPEIRHLAQRLAKLVLVNMRVYWSLYEAEGFLVDGTDVEAC